MLSWLGYSKIDITSINKTGPDKLGKSILVVAAHADDEVLGCAGTIARHVAEGDLVRVVFMADGVTARIRAEATDTAARVISAERAQKILGITSLTHLYFEDNKMDQIPLLDVVQRLETVIYEFNPHMIYTHYWGDLNVDHRITYQAVMTACRPLPGSTVKEIRCFEVLSSTEWSFTSSCQFNPNLFVDISDYLKIKMEAVSAYSKEMRAVPHSRSVAHVENLAKHRGYSVGLDAAEAFVISRAIC